MKYAVISDIHGNFEALNAVLKDIKKRRADIIICLGDVVGYYSDPKSCIELVKTHAAHCVAGNHDCAAIGMTDTSCFTYYAFAAIEWTRQQLAQNEKEYLLSLPLTFERDDMFFTHASPADPRKFTYVFPDNEDSISEVFKNLTHHISFIGHTHWPFILLKEADKVVLHSGSTIEIREECSYLINVGSVGQPRDYDHRSCYALYDTNKRTLTLRRVKYNYRVTQKKVRENNLPVFLAERLEKGR
ncbi:MAG: metallophosphatase family protein [Chitinispirillales bacterium]|jgi:predicted phosphodiesterase|nr:metallophosphatase family protein [Chitinispirillales bacterium]